MLIGCVERCIFLRLCVEGGVLKVILMSLVMMLCQGKD